MLSLLVWVVPLLLIAIALAALKGEAGGIDTGGRGANAFPYRPAKALFTPAERAFLGVLDQAVSPQHRVFGKVRVADIAEVKTHLRGGARQAAFNRISAKHIDFLVCRSSDLAPVCAVELNDKSHASRKAQTRDALLGNVCEAIGLPLLTVPARRVYAVQELRQWLEAATLPVSQRAPPPQTANNANHSGHYGDKKWDA